MTSMTGHGRGEVRSGGWAAVVECFSVNRKNAEVVCHAEHSAWLEPVVREMVLEKVARGRVQVNIVLTHEGGRAGSLLDVERARLFLKEATRLQKELRLPGQIGLPEVLAAPGVIRTQEPSEAGAREAAVAALTKALEGLVATRRREGAALKKSLLRAVRGLRGLLAKIAPLSGAVREAQRETLLKRIAQSALPIPTDDARLLGEIVSFAERSDITEELDRISSHLQQFEEKLEGDGPIGRTLEFLAQELGREFNTIGSKSAHTRIARLVIDAKSELDRLREQLANIE